jgi:hypothetical protein
MRGATHLSLPDRGLSRRHVELKIFNTTRKGPDRLVVQIVTLFVQIMADILNDRDLQFKSKFLFNLNAKRDSSLPSDLRRFAIASFGFPPHVQGVIEISYYGKLWQVIRHCPHAGEKNRLSYFRTPLIM